MKRVKKIVSITLLIVCFTSTLFGCTNSNEITDNNETTTVTDNETKATTIKETEPATEEPTTEEESTEYQYKGKKAKFYEADIVIDKIDNLTLEKGTIVYVNDICKDDIDSVGRGDVAYRITSYVFRKKIQSITQILKRNIYHQDHLDIKYHTLITIM